MAFGSLGMTPTEFWDLEPKELSYAFEGWKQSKEEQMQTSWEQTRWLATTLVNLQVKKPIKAKDLIEFPWDKEKKTGPKSPAPTPEEIENMAKMFGVSTAPPDPEKLKAFHDKVNDKLAKK